MTSYDPTTALVVVDVQNDFADPAGSVAVHGGQALITGINEEVQRAATAGSVIVYTQDWHPESTPHFAKDGGTWPVHCVAGTWGAEFHPELQVVGRAIRKGQQGEDGYSGFQMRDPTSGEETPTELEPFLREAGVSSVVLCGLATDYCVKATALDAVRLGFATTVLAKEIAAVNLEPGDGDRAIEAMRAAGVQVA
ncbi:MAG: isochorismatase family protein [Chloroflexota bacterium]|nr:isochorismatase family protein [Chloroflexota bacterium]